MENKHKQFAPYDRVLVRDVNPYWSCDLYSHFNSDSETHETTALRNVEDNDIIPYEGNEELIGTTEEPEEEIKLKEGEWIACSDKIERMQSGQCTMEIFGDIREGGFATKDLDWIYTFCIRFSDFNPSDMEETRKHILCVKNGKVVRYKG